MWVRGPPSAPVNFMDKFEVLNIIHEISYKLLRFKSLKPGFLYNFRCPFCGDSRKSPFKARGYIFFVEKTGKFFYKCHNCGLSFSFETFLKKFDHELYDTIIFNQYKSEKSTENIEDSVNKEEEHLSVKSIKLSDIESYFLPVRDLPISHFALNFLDRRKLPKSSYDYLFYVENYQELIKKILPDKEKKYPEDPRIIIPFMNEKTELSCIQGRALLNTKVRYITTTINKGMPKIFGMHKRPERYDYIYVFEGPFDAMFFPNGIAVGGADLQSVLEIYPPEKLIFIFDNEPHNKEITKRMEKLILKGMKIFIWPEKSDKIGKDINEAIVKGLSVKDAVNMIYSNSYSGLEAEVKFKIWRAS